MRSETKAKPKVVNGIEGRTSETLIFDFSSPSAWCSCKMGDFDSYLLGEEDFVEKFRCAMKVVRNLSGQKPAEVFNSGSFWHCHVLSDDKSNIVIKLLTTKLGLKEQVIEGEQLMQAGIDDSLRMVGTCVGYVFNVYLVDYNHSLYPDEKKNRSNKTNRKFCPINGMR